MCRSTSEGLLQVQRIFHLISGEAMSRGGLLLRNRAWWTESDSALAIWGCMRCGSGKGEPARREKEGTSNGEVDSSQVPDVLCPWT